MDTGELFYVHIGASRRVPLRAAHDYVTHLCAGLSTVRQRAHSARAGGWFVVPARPAPGDGPIRNEEARVTTVPQTRANQSGQRRLPRMYRCRSRAWRRRLGALAWAALEDLALAAHRSDQGWVAHPWAFGISPAASASPRIPPPAP